MQLERLQKQVHVGATYLQTCVLVYVSVRLLRGLQKKIDCK
jgi:hypothetical protein